MGQIIAFFRHLFQQEADPDNIDIDVKLTDPQIADLSQSIIARHMATIAIMYLGLSQETVENTRFMRQGDYLGFNRDLLVLWRNKNPGINQVQRLADILYSAVEDGGYVDPHKIEQILKVPKTRSSQEPNGLTTEETLTEAEFQRIAERMKPHVERRMKIEPFPWLRDYYVDMNKLYTELTLQKLENEVLGEKSLTLKGYLEMFDSDGRNKILAKADPGMGKTTLGKKMGFDWSKGIFQMFLVVFFVQLKFVKPGEPIENVILQQHPELKGLNVSPENISIMLERFGDRCLLILDGLDEHGLGKNEDVLKVIRNEKLLDCRIIVSSRPHSVSEVEQHFSTIIRVDGFTEKEATKFVSKFFAGKEKIDKILQFKPPDSREKFPVHKCPILLSILCLLVKENEVNLSDANLTIGDLYLNMVQCLYKKFTIRKGLQFTNSEFLKIMRSVGHLALQTLITNNPLLQKNEVLRIAGEFAFEYGFFSGHEDFNLCSYPTADIYVTYVHRSIEEFFGSFGFLQALSDGKSVDDILGSDCKKPIFMVNPLVFKFCLWLLSTKYFDLSKQIYDKLVSYAAKRIDCHTLDTRLVGTLFPAININNPHRKKNKLHSEFFKDVLEKCVGISMVRINKSDMIPYIIDAILARLSPNILDNVTVLSINEDLTSGINIDSSKFNILMRVRKANSPELLKILLKKYNLVKRNPHVYLTVNSPDRHPEDLVPLMVKQIKQLHLIGDISLFTLDLSASGELPYCPLLTCFIAAKCHIEDSVPAAFMKAVKGGKLPSLRRIQLIDCKTDDCEWPEVPEFVLETGTNSDSSQMQKIISQVMELTLDNCSDINHIISKRLEKLAFIELKNATDRDLLQLNDILKEGKLPKLSALHVNLTDKQPTKCRFLDDFNPEQTENLEKLSLQDFITSSQELKRFSQKHWQLRELNLNNSHGMTGSLSVLFTHSFPRLNTLILKSCELNSNDLTALSRASTEGKLPQLKHLDISGEQKFEISDLFTDSVPWNQLITLCASDPGVLNVQPKFLASLEELTLLISELSEVTKITRSWPRLQVLQLDTFEHQISQIIDGVERGMLPALKTLRYPGYIISSSDLLKLYKKNHLG